MLLKILLRKRGAKPCTNGLRSNNKMSYTSGSIFYQTDFAYELYAKVFLIQCIPCDGYTWLPLKIIFQFDCCRFLLSAVSHCSTIQANESSKKSHQNSSHRCIVHGKQNMSQGKKFISRLRKGHESRPGLPAGLSQTYVNIIQQHSLSHKGIKTYQLLHVKIHKQSPTLTDQTKLLSNQQALFVF